MAIQDAPDGTLWVQQVSVVLEAPTPPEPAHEFDAGGAGNYSGASATYQEVVKWAVTADRVGELKEILIISDDYEHTIIQVTVGTSVWATDWSPTSSMPIIFEDLRLAALTEVKVEAKASGGATIDVDAIIVGKEIG